MKGFGICDICNCFFEDLDELQFHRNRAFPCGKRRHFRSVERYNVTDSQNSDVWLQGPLEYSFVKWCLYNNINWNRPKPLMYKQDEKEKKYYPDFHLYDYDVYVETKGGFSKKDQEKMKLVMTFHPNIKLCLIRPTDFTEMRETHDPIVLHKKFAICI